MGKHIDATHHRECSERFDLRLAVINLAKAPAASGVSAQGAAESDSGATAGEPAETETEGSEISDRALHYG
jgi:hypothetical protein